MTGCELRADHGHDVVAEEEKVRRLGQILVTRKRQGSGLATLLDERQAISTHGVDRHVERVSGLVRLDDVLIATSLDVRILHWLVQGVSNSRRGLAVLGPPTVRRASLGTVVADCAALGGRRGHSSPSCRGLGGTCRIGGEGRRRG